MPLSAVSCRAARTSRCDPPPRRLRPTNTRRETNVLAKRTARAGTDCWPSLSRAISHWLDERSSIVFSRNQLITSGLQLITFTDTTGPLGRLSLRVPSTAALALSNGPSFNFVSASSACFCAKNAPKFGILRFCSCGSETTGFPRWCFVVGGDCKSQ